MVKINFREQLSHNNWPNVLDWSHSNLTTLYEAGYRAGTAAAEMQIPKKYIKKQIRKK